MKNIVFRDVTQLVLVLLRTVVQSASQLLTLYLAHGFLYHEDIGDDFLRDICSHKTTRRHIPEEGILRFRNF
jgi:hypothetical protein